MNIRSKLAWTYIILLIIGIITISAYSILTIRSFLLEEGMLSFREDLKATALATASYSSNDNLTDQIRKEAEYSGYDIAVYDSDGIRFIAFPDSAFEDQKLYLDTSLLDSIQAYSPDPYLISTSEGADLVGFIALPESSGPAQYLRLSQDKKEYYAAATSIRHIIYYGMFFSIGAVIIVSILFARYMAQPIQELSRAALDIARGNLDKQINLDRNDEFGTLAKSLNRMASNLRADNEKLKKLNEKQSQFFADITHEIRNPLHTISGSLEMIELENLPEEKKKQYIHTAHKQISRVTRLFEDIKTLQRYDFDQNFVNKVDINLKPLLEEVAKVLRPLAEDKGLELIINAEKNCKVHADPDKIEQVLENLISNAIKYTNKGRVETGYKIKGDRVEVYVKDTGIGISREHLDRLFDRFYRTDKARSRDKGGTGLGLAVVKGILSAHQSEVKVSSKLGQGSRFYFELPLIG